MKFFLIGYMYSGKTTVGKQLAKRLGFNFIDTDNLFEKQFNTTIEAYFSRYGELAFRVAEHQILEDLKDYPDSAVISTGGGFPCFNRNLDLMREIGVVIYLKASVSVIYNRFVHSTSPRPLLMGLNKEESIQKIETQLADREHFYNQANVIIPADNVNIETLQRCLAPFF